MLVNSALAMMIFKPVMLPTPLVILNLFQDNTQRWCVTLKQVQGDGTFLGARR